MDLDLDALLSFAIVSVLLVSLARGIIATIELNRIYKQQNPSLLLGTIRFAVVTLVFAAAWFGFFTILAIVGIGPFPIVRVINIGIVILVFDLPHRFLRTIRKIQRGGPDGPLPDAPDEP